MSNYQIALRAQLLDAANAIGYLEMWIADNCVRTPDQPEFSGRVIPGCRGAIAVAADIAMGTRNVDGTLVHGSETNDESL